MLNIWCIELGVGGIRTLLNGTALNVNDCVNNIFQDHFKALLGRRIRYKKWQANGGAERAKSKKSSPRGVSPSSAPRAKVPHLEKPEIPCQEEEADSRISEKVCTLLYFVHLLNVNYCNINKRNMHQNDALGCEYFPVLYINVCRTFKADVYHFLFVPDYP